jgi:hypothetical protein
MEPPQQHGCRVDTRESRHASATSVTHAHEASRDAIRIGFWSAALTAASCAAFTIAALFTERGVLRVPWDAVLSLTPSLLLAASFLTMMVCINATTPADRRIWSQLGVAFAVVYVPLCSASYIVELFVVVPRVLRGAGQDTVLLTIARGDSVFNAIDGLGYIFMCVATLLAAPAFGAARLDRWIRRCFVANGATAVPIFITYFVNRSFIYAAALWSVTVTASALLLAVRFRRLLTPTGGSLTKSA